MRTTTLPIVFAALVLPLAAEINPATTATTATPTEIVSAIRECAASIPLPSLFTDAMKSVNKWEKKKSAALPRPITPDTVMLVGTFDKLYSCVGAENPTQFTKAARQMRYVVHNRRAPALFNYEEEIISLAADYEAGVDRGRLRAFVGGWLVSAKALTSGLAKTAALQLEHQFLRDHGVPTTDGNLRILRMRIAESAVLAMSGQELELPLRARPTRQIAAR